MRDALEFEWLGIPSVAIIADALQGPAEAMLRLCGMEGYSYIVTAFPVGALDAVALRARALSHVAGVASLLFDRRATQSPAPLSEPPENDLMAFGDDDEAQRAFTERGWTDGAVVVLPTPARVSALLAATSRHPDEIVVRLDTRDGLDASVHQIAVNAVMAGVDPALFAVVLTALDAMADPAYNLHAHTATMAGAQQLLIVRGPNAARLGFRSEDGALGPGWPANNRVGRAVRLIVRNLLRSVHGEFDRAGFSHPGRFGWCVAEDPRSPWPLGEVVDEVLAYATTWQASIINHQQDASALLDEIGFAIRANCQVNWLHREVASDSSFYADRPFLLVTGAEHARVLCRDGFADHERLQDALYARLTEPDGRLLPVAIASSRNLHVLYLHATGMQQSWFFAPFQSHSLVRRAMQC